MSLTISRILHAGYLFSFGDTKIVFDPIFENPFSTNCYAFPPVEFHETKIKELQIAAVFISHYHDDHCSLKSLNLLNRATPIYIFCQHAEMLEMVEQLGFNKVKSIELNQPMQINEFEIIARRALDAEVDSIFHIRVGGINILNVVDSWIDEETMQTLQLTTIWDLILWPFQTMREIEVLAPSRMTKGDPTVQELPPEWTAQIERLKPKVIVPSSCQFKLESWSWYNQVFFPITYKKFEEEINRVLPSVKVLRLDPSQSIELSFGEIRKAPAVPWVRLLTTAIVDYDFDATVEVPKTSEIAKNFPALSAEQRNQVIDYCRNELMSRYSSLEELEDDYFVNECFWQLTIFDQTGIARDFFYQLKGQRISLCLARPVLISWTSEISMFKLHRALFYGETLTSLYMRINDLNFENEIEVRLKTADSLRDPLIRCLFEGVFGAYQRKQLRDLGLN